ncbi:MAG: hypothetical protein AAGE84_05455 [Cyanobacteria bacterium P01_G01_bin.39]
MEKKTEQALKDYSMLPDGVEVVDKAILGRRERTLSKGLHEAYLLESKINNKGIFRRGAISLICTDKNNVLLLVQDYRPTRNGKAAGIGEVLFEGSSISYSNLKKTKISHMIYLYRGYFDVYVSDPLSKAEIFSILEILNIKDIAWLGIYAFDQGNNFTAEFNLPKVKQLIDNCQS